MKTIAEMQLAELAAYVQTHLQQAGIQVVLSGGSAVSFYSDSRYISKDIDLIDNGLASRKQIRTAMERIGFQSDGRYFRHPETDILVKFPGGPLSVGEELVRDFQTIPLETGTLRVITPTDCVKDRLCAYYFWNDHQGLSQAILVARQQSIDLEAIRQWSMKEGQSEKFSEFENQI
jgi:hypothetical protein